MRWMSRGTTGVLLGGLVASTGVAGPIRVDEVPADSSVVIHVDVERLVDSEVGEMILDEAGDDLRQLEEVERELGIDPLHDLRDVTICLMGDEEDEVVIYASVSDALEETMGRLEEYGDEIDLDVVERFGGLLHSFRIDGERVHALVREDHGGYRVALSPHRRLVAIAGKTLEGEHEAMGDMHGLARIEAREGAFAQMLIPDLGAVPMDPDDVPESLREMVRTVYGEVGERDGEVFARCLIRMGDDEDAERLEQVGLGLIAMVQLAQSLDEGRDRDLQRVARLLRGFVIERDGNIVQALLEVDVDDAMDLIEHAE